MRLAVAAAFVLSAGHASAEPRVATAEAPEPATKPPGLTEAIDLTPRRALIDRAAAGDAAYDRGFLVSTALVLGQASFDVSARSALKTVGIASVAAGLGGHVELSVDVAKAGGIGKELGVGAKVGVVRHDTWAVAATGSVHDVYQANNSDANQVYQLGMRITTCTGSACGAQFTFGGGFAATTNTYSSITDNLSPELDASFIIGRGYIRPLLELTVLDGYMGYLGLRFGNRYVAFDAGVGTMSAGGEFRNSDLLAMFGLSVRP